MTPKQISLVQESWKKVKPIAPQAAEIFYNTLFEMDPSVKPLFKGDIVEQGVKLMTMLDTAVSLLNSPDKLIPAVQKLGAGHVNYGVTAAHYDTVGAALLKTLEIGLGDAFTAPVKKAWTAVYTVLAKTMIEAAEHASSAQPNKSKGKNTAMSQDNQSTSIDNALAARLQGALDQSATPFIMVDRDFFINYANQATLALLKKHEATFAIKWPGFTADPDKIIGTNIDGFHEKPEHQRKLLDDPANLPYTTDISIEHLTFELNVSAINDTDGNYIGNSLEWQDVTEARASADSAVQLQGAIDQSGTASMMIDRDFLITYANDATMKILIEHEETFAKVFPGFKADPEAVMGTCIDVF
ncbi:MAG: PAS domain-containing protein, partial [Colwellia sp.]|nr:PAS domain-containing protein [Colwellia sp.]